MILAEMLAVDEAALACDMAESYGVYDLWALPARTAATLAAGLRPFSRIWAKLNGLDTTLDVFLQASVLDCLRLLWWAKTEDGQKNQNRPDSVLSILIGKDEEKEAPVAIFASGEDFEREWKRQTGGDHGQ